MFCTQNLFTSDKFYRSIIMKNEFCCLWGNNSIFFILLLKVWNSPVYHEVVVFLFYGLGKSDIVQELSDRCWYLMSSVTFYWHIGNDSILYFVIKSLYYYLWSFFQNTTLSKSILHEYAAKLKVEKPAYNTVQLEGLLPLFVSSMTFQGTTYVGDAARSKKEAEQLAARNAITSILGILYYMFLDFFPFWLCSN